MWISLKSSTVALNAQQPLSLRHARGVCVSCVQGTIWLTAEGEAGDVLLRPGQNHRLRCDGLVLIEALPQAMIRLERPAAWPLSLASRMLRALPALRLGRFATLEQAHPR